MFDHRLSYAFCVKSLTIDLKYRTRLRISRISQAAQFKDRNSITGKYIQFIMVEVFNDLWQGVGKVRGRRFESANDEIF